MQVVFYFWILEVSIYWYEYKANNCEYTEKKISSKKYFFNSLMTL